MPEQTSNQGQVILSLLASAERQHYLCHFNLSMKSVLQAAPEIKKQNYRVSAAFVYLLGDKWRLLMDGGILGPEQVSQHQHERFLLAGLIYLPDPSIEFDIGYKIQSAQLSRKRNQSQQIGMGLTLHF